MENKLEKLAGEVLHISRNTLMMHLRFMDKAISMLSCEPALESQGLFMNAKGIFYDPWYVLQSFQKKKEIPVHQYLHMVLHGVYQHFWVSTLVNQDYWDLACDIAVEYTIQDMGLAVTEVGTAGAQQKEFDKLGKKVKYMTADMLYAYFLGSALSESETGRLQALFAFDRHDLWYQRESRSVKDTGLPASDGAFSQQMCQEWKEIAQQMMLDLETFSKEQGSGTGGLTQNLLAVTRERYDYTKFLKKFAVLGEGMKINDEEFDYVFYTYGLHLYGKMPLIEPLEYKEVKQIREFVIAIDTSGSTGGDLVQAFMQKTYNILKQQESFFTKFNLHLVQCDAKIREAVKITNQQEFDDYLKTMEIRGLGGTDFRPVFAYVDELIAKKEFQNLKGMIYFTDGLGVFPAKQPDYQVAVVYVEEGYENPEVPVWAIKLVLTPEDIHASGL